RGWTRTATHLLCGSTVMVETLYLSCAILGGTLLLCQLLLGLFGFGDHHDTGTDHHVHGSHDCQDAHDSHAAWFTGVLTFRSVVAALTLFGLTGLTATVNLQFDPFASLVLAVAAGAAVLFLVAWLMKSLHRLKSDGTVRIERALGRNGTV